MCCKNRESSNKRKICQRCSCKLPPKKAILEVNLEDNNSDEYIQRIRSIGYSAQEEIAEEKKK